MNDLSRHIERLLLDNDCVIVPGLGGFISYNVSARYVREENLYLPPMRTIGFNAQLVLNDGLLVQSYMQYNDVSYPEALRILESDIDDVKDLLQNEGCVDFSGIGLLHYTMEGSYNFKPCECGILSPALYGLNSFSISELASGKSVDIAAVNEAPVIKTKGKKSEVHEELEEKEFEEKDKRNLTIKINRKVLDYSIAIAASIALFFALSIPVKNTYVNMENYASLSYSSLFNDIKNKSLVLNVIKSGNLDKVAVKPATMVAETSSHVPDKIAETKAETNVEVKENAENPTAEKENKAIPAIKQEPVAIAKSKPVAKEVVESAQGKYKVIIASVDSRKMAEYMVSQATAKGYSGAFILEGKKHFRVAISAHSTLTEAYNKINRLHKDSAFMDAWVLSPEN